MRVQTIQNSKRVPPYLVLNNAELRSNSITPAFSTHYCSIEQLCCTLINTPRHNLMQAKLPQTKRVTFNEMPRKSQMH